MFERIFLYSTIDKKENHIGGALSAVKFAFLLFPLSGVCMALFSCYVVHLSDVMYRAGYYVVTVLLAVGILYGVLQWLKEMFTVYAIGRDGRVYRFQMMAFAMNYLGFRNKIGEIAGKGGGRLAGTFELMIQIKQTIEGLEKEQQIEEMFAQGYVTELKDIHVMRKGESKLRLSAMAYGSNGGKKIKDTIRKVYGDWENLFCYLEHKGEDEQNDLTNFEFLKKTTYEDLMVPKPGYLKRVLRQSFWVVAVMSWLAVFMLSGDLNKEGKVRSGMYTAVDAQVSEVEEKREKKENIIADYEVDGEHYNMEMLAEKGKYNVGEAIEVYYEVNQPKNHIIFAEGPHVNYKPIGVLFLFFEAVILAMNIEIKPKAAAQQRKAS